MKNATSTESSADKSQELMRELMRELNDAYNGLYTLPLDHPARLAYNKAWAFLEGR